MMTSKTEAKNSLLSSSGLVDDELEFNKNLYKRLLFEVLFSWKKHTVEFLRLHNKEFQKSYILFHFFLFVPYAHIKLEMCLYVESHADTDNFNEVRSYVSNVISHSID